MHLYCSDYYKSDALAKTYEILMVSMLDKVNWSAPKNMIDETVYLPRYRRLFGRSRKRRKKIQMNTVNTIYCGQEGHNRRICTFFSKEK